LRNDELNKISLQFKNIYNDIINSCSFQEFVLLEKIRLLEFTYNGMLNDQKQIYEEKLNYQKHVYEERIKFTEQLIHRMNSSNSWKLTIPLRKIGELVKKINKPLNYVLLLIKENSHE
jgi:hypothetical protein